MRSVLVLLAMSFSITAGAFAVEKANAEVKADYLRPYVIAPENTQSAGQFSFVPRTVIKRKLSPTDNTCYTIHSMLVEKQPGSDATEIVGQQTCTPSSRFQMKHSVQRPK
jgi:hypothetical protein